MIPGTPRQRMVRGRLVLIIDELQPGKFITDIDSDLHPAKLAVIFLSLFKQYSAKVDDEMQRKEIMKQFDYVMDIVTGKKGPGPAGEPLSSPPQSIFPGNAPTGNIPGDPDDPVHN